MNEKQILAELLSQAKQIKWLLIFLTGIFTLCGIGITYILVVTRKFSLENKRSEIFREKVDALLDKDDLDKVIHLSKAKLREYPKEIYAHWYLAQAYYRKKEWVKALEELNLIYETVPSWREEFVNPYIEDVKDQLKQSKPEIVKE